MISHPLQRPDLPEFEVYVQSEDRKLQPATDMLAADVRADLLQTKRKIAEAFGSQSLPEMQQDTVEALYGYFENRKWSLPQSVVLDPDRDALKLREILQEAAFPSKSDQEFFTGAYGQVRSPGGCFSLDTVIFHDMRKRYREYVANLVGGWGYEIDDASLERVTELQTADIAAHELSHYAGGLAMSAVVIEKKDRGYGLASSSNG